jgi:predicted DsbA family dithiol-disulfide isomerase
MGTQAHYQLIEPVGERDHISGLRSAPISLVEYGDFECPYCRAAEPIVAALREAFGEHLSLTFRHFPMREVHPHGEHAAEVAEAAGSQGMFWEMHDTLFANQNALDDSSLLRYAAGLGLDAGRVERELADRVHSDRVDDDRSGGLASGVNGTPTFYIDGLRYEGSVGLRQMLAAIRELHPDVEVAETAPSSLRIPRVAWPNTRGAQGRQLPWRSTEPLAPAAPSNAHDGEAGAFVREPADRSAHDG